MDLEELDGFEDLCMYWFKWKKIRNFMKYLPLYIILLFIIVGYYWQDCEGVSDCWGENKIFLIWLFIVFFVILIRHNMRKYNRRGGYHGNGYHGDGGGGDGGGDGGE